MLAGIAVIGMAGVVFARAATGEEGGARQEEQEGGQSEVQA